VAGTIDRHGVIVGCPSCGSANRLRFNALAKAARCGKCQTPLAPPAAPVEIGDAATFDAAAAQSAVPMIVDFWAPWCGPCRMVAPELERVARANAGRYLVAKVNTDVVTEIAERFRILSIPTLVIMFGGQEIDRVMGVRPAREIEAFVARALEKRDQRAS
jgi:thioredoxin 2